MSDVLISSQQTEINRLNKELAETRAEAKKYRVERSGLRKQVETLTAERDDLTGKLKAAPSELQAKVDDLTGQLRTRDHWDAWATAIGGELADKATVEDLWQKVGYKVEADLVDPRQITELVGKAREAAPYLFKPADSSTTSATDPRGSTQASRLTLPASGDAAGRGAPAKAPGVMQVKKSDLQNPRVALDPAHIAARQQAHKEGRLQIVE